MDVVDELAEALRAEIFMRGGATVPASLVFSALAKATAGFLAECSPADRATNALSFMREVATCTEVALVRAAA